MNTVYGKKLDAGPRVNIFDNIAKRVKMSREGADVQRMHSTPPLRPYPNGMHTFNMLAMLRIIWPDAPVRLIWAILEHDVPSERYSGDMPAPAKWFNLMNRDAMQHLEMRINEEVWGYDTVRDLSESELKWLHALDLIEFYCFCRDEVMHGNHNMSYKVNDVEQVFDKIHTEWPAECIDLFYELKCHDWAPTPDIGLEDLR